MGCTSSKQARRDSRWRSPQLNRSYYSLPAPRHGGRNGESCQVVSLNSSTRGSPKLDTRHTGGSSDEEVMMGTTDIERRLPWTQTKTEYEEPETINAWELMAGLEDSTPLPRASPAAAGRSFSFHTVRDAGHGLEYVPKPKLGNWSPPTMPSWMQNAPKNSVVSIVSDFDPEIISTFQKALDELSPQHRFLLRSPEPEKIASINGFEVAGNSRDIPKFTGIVKSRITIFQERIDARKANCNGNAEKVAPSDKCPPGGKGKLVFYFTSLRGVRETYEDCWAVRVILQGYSVKIDERDLSMHGGFKEELNEMIGGGRLPRVFADGRYLGGAEDVRQMHEAGELGRALEGCEMVTLGKGGVGGQCEGCGDVRFVPCETCSGSCKVYLEEEEEGEEAAGGFWRCPDCNENGLVRCPLCSRAW